MPKIVGFTIHSLEVPFRKPFKHAAAERHSSESLYLECRLDSGESGFGEALPRDYVTGETRDGAVELLRDEILPRLVGRSFESLADVITFLQECDGKAPADWLDPARRQTAAWCAVDLALLDAIGRATGEPVRLSPERTLPESLRYSVVISSDAKAGKLLLMRLFGFRQAKLKVEADDAVDAVRRTRKFLGKRCEVRTDANMAWNVEEAIEAIRAMAAEGVFSHEQPVPADDFEGLARLVRETDADIMVDESLHDAESLDKLINLKACSAVNVRVSKCGGLVAARARCQQAAAAGLTLQVGCQVGETSLLSAAHLILMMAVPGVRYAEGCFGKHLLGEDPAEPLLQFGLGGSPPDLPDKPGLGVTINREALDRYSTSSVAIE